MCWQPINWKADSKELEVLAETKLTIGQQQVLAVEKAICIMGCIRQCYQQVRRGNPSCLFNSDETQLE